MNKEALKKEAEEYALKQWEGNIPWSIIQKSYFDGALPREKRIAELEAQIEKMKKYIKACWVEENLNDYSSYITNTSDEFRDLVHELNEEIRNGR